MDDIDPRKFMPPCHFPIKIIAHDTQTIEEKIKHTVNHYFPKTADSAWSENQSKTARYRAWTVNLSLTDENTLKQLNDALKNIPEVIMVL